MATGSPFSLTLRWRAKDGLDVVGDPFGVSRAADRKWVVVPDLEGNEFDVLRTLAPQKWTASGHPHPVSELPTSSGRPRPTPDSACPSGRSGYARSVCPGRMAWQGGTSSLRGRIQQTW
ncbi:hypothetical protein GCM10018775_71870 [Streptomyces umbrinus]|nr:hypothetical protein GCM10018775_71870 [Streptomyces umbrinus]